MTTMIKRRGAVALAALGGLAAVAGLAGWYLFTRDTGATQIACGQAHTDYDFTTMMIATGEADPTATDTLLVEVRMSGDDYHTEQFMNGAPIGESLGVDGFEYWKSHSPGGGEWEESQGAGLTTVIGLLNTTSAGEGNVLCAPTEDNVSRVGSDVVNGVPTQRYRLTRTYVAEDYALHDIFGDGVDSLPDDYVESATWDYWVGPDDLIRQTKYVGKFKLGNVVEQHTTVSGIGEANTLPAAPVL